MSSSTKLSAYIEDKLLKIIKEEMQDHILTNERDIESSIYHHLRVQVGKIDGLRLATNFSINKFRVAPGKTSFRQPDIVILKTKIRPNPIIAIEIKRKLRSNNVLETVIKKDIKKLEKFRKAKIIQKGYIIFVTNNKKSKAIDLVEQSQELVSDKKIKVLVVNPIENYDNNEQKEYFKNLKTFEKYNYKKEKVHKQKRSRAAKKRSQTLGKINLKKIARNAAKTKQNRKIDKQKEQRKENRKIQRKRRKKRLHK
tara:strand:+ start:102 stop:863 length:762 start_codon:yes stop_codon:yes gene_type:complete